MLVIPEGCAHGCQSLEDDTEFFYMASALYSPDHATGVRHDDPAFSIAWPRKILDTSSAFRRRTLDPSSTTMISFMGVALIDGALDALGDPG
jgi:dTDP-4-dehydrorhamnose 3,5-epimerase